MNIFGYVILPAKALQGFKEAAENLQDGVNTVNGRVERELFRSLHTMAVFREELDKVVKQTGNPLAKALQGIAVEESEILSDKLHKLKGR